MCLTAKDIEIKVATEDIKVKKLFVRDEGRLVSPFMWHRYEPGRQQPIKLTVHSRKGLPLTNAARIANPEANSHIRQGYHSCLPECEYQPNDDEEFWLECTIPAGSEYAVCNYGCVVSSELIVPEIKD